MWLSCNIDRLLRYTDTLHRRTFLTSNHGRLQNGLNYVCKDNSWINLQSTKKVGINIIFTVSVLDTEIIGWQSS
ncbi:hypothetical protein DPMN_124991 [Dreissena polymorpha]|uniref:Uncharacterized protein n=1 Tax=Dreissena polymorpha TaxID=45954 RepID=A0A9D4JWP6_DREPO|nr:hypothetical protein DPMN_124991 [Dreissena polymorpha]